MNQQLFDDLIGVEPVSAVDVRDIVRRERRSRRLRRAGIGTMLLVVIVAVSLTLTLGGMVRHNSPASPPSPSPVTSFRLIGNDRESARVSAAQLSEAIDQALKAHVPGVRWVGVDGFGEVRGNGQPPQVDWGVPAMTENTFTASGYIRVKGRVGTVAFEVNNLPCAGASCGSSDESSLKEARERLLNCARPTNPPVWCAEGPDPRGRLVSKATFSDWESVSAPARRSESVAVLLGTRLVLRISDGNTFSPASDPTRPPFAWQADLPLTMAQLYEVIEDVADRVVT